MLGRVGAAALLSLPHPVVADAQLTVLMDALRISEVTAIMREHSIVLPADRYFMLGDNRETSLDSRYWGLLEGWRLEGRAVFTYFSYNKESYRPFPWVREVRWDRIGDPIR